MPGKGNPSGRVGHHDHGFGTAGFGAGVDDGFNPPLLNGEELGVEVAEGGGPNNGLYVGGGGAVLPAVMV